MKLLWPIPTCLLKDPNKPQTVEVEVPYLHAKDVVCGEKMAVLTRDHAPWDPPMDEEPKGLRGKGKKKSETEDDAAEKPCTDIQNQIGSTYQMLTWGHLTDAVLLANSRSPVNPFVQATVARGLEHVTVFHDSMPDDVASYLVRLHNHYHGGAPS